MTRETFRKQMIEAMCVSGILLSNELGKGYIDWHTENDDCGVTFITKDKYQFDVCIDLVD